MERIADRLRPKTLEDIIGHENIKKVLLGQLKGGNLSNVILYGGSGSGKTSISLAISKMDCINKPVYKLDASTATLNDLKDILNQSNNIFNINGCILAIEEIHMYTKRELQILLSYLENGKITLIATTTENPYSVLPQGITSRCLVLQLNRLTQQELKLGIKNALKKLSIMDNKKISITPPALNALINLSPHGDLRQLFNILESVLYSKFYYNHSEIKITLQDIKIFNNINGVNYNSNETTKYNLISALQKSIRNSDVDSSLYYIGLLIKSGDLDLIKRRIEIIAFEDISLANPTALLVTTEGLRIVKEIGLKEGQIILANVVTLLALSKKSNAPYLAIKEVMKDLSEGHIYDVPNHLKTRNKQPGGQEYLYPHDYENNYVEQQCLPDELVGRVYYQPGNNVYEQTLYKNLEKIKKDFNKTT